MGDCPSAEYFAQETLTGPGFAKCVNSKRN